MPSPKSWRVTLRRDGKIERTVEVEHIAARVRTWTGAGEPYEEYEITAVMPATLEAVADFCGGGTNP